jgi:hypothetical protein
MSSALKINPIRASINAAVLTSLLQLAANSLKVGRLRYLSGSSPTYEDEDNLAPSSSTQVLESLRRGRADTENPVMEENSFPAKVLAGLGRFAPVSRLTDEEYLRRLQKQRADIIDRLDLLALEEERVLDASDKGLI